MFKVFALKVHYESSLRMRQCLAAPAASKNSTDISDDFTNTANARVASSQDIFNTLQPGSREEAVSSSSQNVSEASGAVCKYIQIESFQILLFPCFDINLPAWAICLLARLTRASFKTTFFCSHVGTAEATAMKRAKARMTFMVNSW